MRFLIDAHLPPSLCRQLREAGHEALHTSSLPLGNHTHDREINALAVFDGWIVVTKDTDFYYSHVLNGRPPKLVLVRTGNLGTQEFKSLFMGNLPRIALLLETYSLVELGSGGAGADDNRGRPSLKRRS